MIKKIATNGVVSIIAGTFGVYGNSVSGLALGSTLNSPNGIEVNSNTNEIYFSDSGNFFN